MGTQGRVRFDPFADDHALKGRFLIAIDEGEAWLVHDNLLGTVPPDLTRKASLAIEPETGE